MTIEKAIGLIRFKHKNSSPQLWLDLGCGTGLFTLALASQLPAASTIIAVDRDENSLRKIPSTFNNVRIKAMVADFITGDLKVEGADGIMMANSLHFVKNKETFLDKLIPALKTDAVFLLGEYDRITANPWVLYPIPIDAAQGLFNKLGYQHFQVLGKRRSVYGSHDIYAAIISQ